MHGCSLGKESLLRSIFGEGRIGLAESTDLAESGNQGCTPFRSGMVFHTFIRVPRCGTIPKAFDGHPQFLLARPGLVKSKSANGRHPIFGVVVKAAKLRDFTSGLWRCDQKQKSRTCQCEVARLVCELRKDIPELSVLLEWAGL